jgi:hypothetical protein
MDASKNKPTRAPRTRGARPIKMPRVASSRRITDTRATLVGGATLLAAAAATTGAVLMRRTLARLAVEGVTQAVMAGKAVGSYGSGIGRGVGESIKNLDLEELLMLAGLKRRPSLFARMLLPLGAFAAVAAAAGSAVFFMAPKLRAASENDRLSGDDVDRRKNVDGKMHINGSNYASSAARTTPLGDPGGTAYADRD